MCVVRHMLYGSFGIQNLVVTSISKFDPRKGKYHVKLGQIRSFFQIWKCAYKCMPILFRLFQDSKNTIHFYVRQLEMPKNAFQKLTSSPLHDCLEIAQPKIKILAWKFACVLFIRILMMHIPVFWCLEYFEFCRQLLLKDRNCWFLGSNKKISKIWCCHFVES